MLVSLWICNGPLHIFSPRQEKVFSVTDMHPVFCGTRALKGIKGWTRFWGCQDTYCPQTDHVPMNTSLHLVRRLFSKRQLGLKVLRLILTLIVLKTVGRDFQTKAKDIWQKLKPVYWELRDSAPIGTSIMVNKAEPHLESFGASKGYKGWNLFFCEVIWECVLSSL